MLALWFATLFSTFYSPTSQPLSPCTPDFLPSNKSQEKEEVWGTHSLLGWNTLIIRVLCVLRPRFPRSGWASPADGMSVFLCFHMWPFIFSVKLPLPQKPVDFKSYLLSPVPLRRGSDRMPWCAPGSQPRPTHHSTEFPFNCCESFFVILS